MTDDRGTEPFESARPRLRGRAYRIVGTIADADDIVQEAWIRWNGVNRGEVERPEAWLNTVVTRLSLDRLRSRKREEARYVGPWLPAPLVERAVDPAETTEISDSLTTAFLMLLEHLTPDERAAFLLTDVFGERSARVASILDRTPESCRQLASRARRKLRAADEQRRDTSSVAADTVRRFLGAIAAGDERAAMACVAADAVYLSDGGPEHRAARYPVRGPERIVRLIHTLASRYPADWRFEPAVVGGFPGIVIDTGSRIYSAISFEVVGGRIVRMMSMINPDKLVGIEIGPTAIE